MRIVCIGQAAFGEQVLKKLVERGEEVVGVYTTPDIKGKTNPLALLAQGMGIRVFQPQNMKAPEVYEEYSKLKPDLNVMAFVTGILPRSILDYPKLGTIQYHPSLLPRHRGASSINWAVISGETRTGISIFWPDKGIDTGPILLQKEVTISPDDTVGSLYFNKLFPLGIEALAESIELIKTGKAPRIPQDETQATYEGLCTEKDSAVSWSQPAAKVYNLIRGTNPQPGARTGFNGLQLKVFDCELIESEVEGSPGEVIKSTTEGFVVKAAGGAILVKKVQPEGSPKITASEFARQRGLKAGDKLGG